MFKRNNNKVLRIISICTVVFFLTNTIVLARPLHKEIEDPEKKIKGTCTADSMRNEGNIPMVEFKNGRGEKGQGHNKKLRPIENATAVASGYIQAGKEKSEIVSALTNDMGYTETEAEIAYSKANHGSGPRSKHEKLEPYGHNKDNRKELYGNRGRPIRKAEAEVNEEAAEPVETEADAEALKPAEADTEVKEEAVTSEDSATNQEAVAAGETENKEMASEGEAEKPAAIANEITASIDELKNSIQGLVDDGKISQEVGGSLVKILDIIQELVTKLAETVEEKPATDLQPASEGTENSQEATDQANEAAAGDAISDKEAIANLWQDSYQAEVDQAVAAVDTDENITEQDYMSAMWDAFNSGDYELAGKICQSIIKTFGEQADNGEQWAINAVGTAYHMLGQVLEKQGENDLAASAYKVQISNYSEAMALDENQEETSVTAWSQERLEALGETIDIDNPGEVAKPGNEPNDPTAQVVPDDLADDPGSIDIDNPGEVAKPGDEPNDPTAQVVPDDLADDPGAIATTLTTSIDELMENIKGLVANGDISEEVGSALISVLEIIKEVVAKLVEKIEQPKEEPQDGYTLRPADEPQATNDIDGQTETTENTNNPTGNPEPSPNPTMDSSNSNIDWLSSVQVDQNGKIVAPADGSIYIGAYDWDENGKNGIAEFEQATGLNVAIGNPSYINDNTGSEGQLPSIDITGHEKAYQEGFQTTFGIEFNMSSDPTIIAPTSPQGILNGALDPQLEQIGKDLKAWGKPIFFLYQREPLIQPGLGYDGGGYGPNGQQTKDQATNNGQDPQAAYTAFGDPNKLDGPERYVAACQYIHDKIESIAPGQATWVMGANVGYQQGHYERFYPGNDYVDWHAFDYYPGTEQGTPTYPYDSISNMPTWQEAINLAPDKPVMLVEFGIHNLDRSTGQPQDRQSWFDSFFNDIETNSDLKNLKAIMYWQQGTADPVFNTRIRTSDPIIF